MPETTSKTFGARLVEALEFQGITDPAQQVEKVAQACQITAKTARKYLRATDCPVFLSCKFTRFYALAKAIGAKAEWLFDGTRPSPKDVRFLEYIGSLSKWEQDKTWRFAVRLLNDCPKARRLSAMEQAGQISRHQLLAAM